MADNASGDGSAAAPPRRAGWAVLLVASALWLGFGAGTFAAGRWLVPAGSGLAGPPIALGYGVLSGIALGVVAAIVAWKAPARGVRVAALIAVLLGCALTAAMVVGVVLKNAQGLGGF